MARQTNLLITLFTLGLFGVLLGGFLVYSLEGKNADSVAAEMRARTKSADAGLMAGDGQNLIGEALTAFQRGDAPKAVALVKAYLTVHPEDTSARRLLILIAFDRKNYTEAVAQCQVLIALDPGDTDALLSLAKAYVGLGQNAQAQAACNDLLASRSSTPGQRIEARAILRRLKRKKPTAPPAPAFVSSPSVIGGSPRLPEATPDVQVSPSVMSPPMGSEVRQ